MTNPFCSTSDKQYILGAEVPYPFDWAFCWLKLCTLIPALKVGGPVNNHESCMNVGV